MGDIIRIPTIAVESIVFTFVAIKAIQAKTWRLQKDQNLLVVFVRDGTWAFLCVFGQYIGRSTSRFLGLLIIWWVNNDHQKHAAICLWLAVDYQIDPAQGNILSMCVTLAAYVNSLLTKHSFVLQLAGGFRSLDIAWVAPKNNQSPISYSHHSCLHTLRHRLLLLFIAGSAYSYYFRARGSFSTSALKLWALPYTLK